MSLQWDSLKQTRKKRISIYIFNSFDGIRLWKHMKRLQILIVEIHQSLRAQMGFVNKDIPYILGSKKLCKIPSMNYQYYIIKSLSFRRILLLNALCGDIKITTSLMKFKK